MDPDELKFYLLLYLIYLGDCFILPKSSGLLLYSRFRGMQQRVKSTESAGIFAGRFWLLRPLFAPIGESRMLEFYRGSFGANGYCSVSPLGETASGGERARYISYDQIEKVEVRDLTLWINDEKWFAGSRGLYGLKNDLVFIANSKDHGAAVKTVLEAAFKEGRSAGDLLAGLQKKTEWLNLFCSMYAILLLLFLPFALFHLPTRLLLWGVAVPFVVLHLICCGLYLIVHRKLLPTEKGHRWEHFVKMILCPPMLIRACDVIEDRAGLPGDAAVCLMNCSDVKIWKPAVGKIWRRLIPCSYEQYSTDIADAVLSFSGLYRDLLSRELKRNDLNTDVFEVDAKTVSAGQMFCPRCAAQFRDGMTTCNDCGGVELVAGEGE